MKSLRFAVAICLLLLVGQLPMMGQGFQTGSVTGTVVDQSGAALPGATVTLKSVDRGTTRVETTDSNGRYRFATIPLGRYSLETELQGFQTVRQTDVLVGSDTATTIDVVLKLAATAEEITVTADSPVVDPTNTTQTTRVSVNEYEKAPIGRSYQTVARLAPGVIGGANPNANGALASNNQYLFDGVDATDPTTGTFGANLNFEAIQEVSVLTTGVSAEYGRSTGAIINVVTKSGTNTFEGSLKAIATNDKWDEQNKTKNQVTGASLSRNKLDHDNIRYSATLGGPIVRDRAWFFGAYEEFEQFVSPRTTTVTQEEFSDQRMLELHNYRASFQITPSHQAWVRYGEDPYTGILTGYVETTDLFTITEQGQGGEQWVGQYSGVIGSKIALEALAGSAESIITVQPYKVGPFDNGAAIYDLGQRKYFNGLFFGADNRVSRPRDQFTGAASYFATIGGNSHDFKFGIDLQQVESLSYYSYGNNRLYYVRNYDAATGTFTPVQRFDFQDPGPQTSEGEMTSFYVRDKFTVGKKIFIEAGIRYEDQTGNNDVGTKVVDAQSWAPRVSMNYDVMGDGKTIVSASAGIYNDFLVQSYVDSFAQNASRANYDLYNWNAATQSWVFAETVISGGSNRGLNLGLTPPSMTEFTVGVQRQLGRQMGVGVRYINRVWDDLVDDFYRFTSPTSNSVRTDFVNLDEAERDHQAVQLTFDKRFANNWSLLANYTYSETRGNHFANTATLLNDFPTNNCRSTDPTVGTIPCAEAAKRLYGTPGYDRPHTLNLLGTYALTLGPVDLTAGLGGFYQSGAPYSKATSLTVLREDGNASSSTFTYLYEGLGSDRLDAQWQADTSLEATYRLFGVQLGLKGEVFNITDNQDQILVNNTSWCNADTAACQTTRNRFGTATARASYMTPRNYRLTALIRF